MVSSIAGHLRSLVRKGSVFSSVPLCDYTTMQVGGRADFLVEPADEAEICAVLRLSKHENIPLLLLGNGSNIVVSDGGFHGIALHLGKNWSNIQLDHDMICAQSGALLPVVSRAAAASSLTGMEFACGIPGSIGGSVCMNAGAYGGEMKNILLSARIYADGMIREVSGDDLCLSYRHSNVMLHNWLVLSVKLQLQHGESDQIKGKMDSLNANRRAKQPLQYPSCGSFFKRPEGNYAAALIDQAGLKGFTIGGAQVSMLHAGFIVNIGNACANDIYQLMLFVQKKVFEQFGVHLEPEVRLIGDFGS